MKKLTTTLILFIAACWVLNAAEPDGRCAFPVNVGFYPPVSTNGPDCSNVFSFNIISGTSYNENGCTLAGITNIIRNDATGFQMAGIGNITKGRVTGTAFSGLLNTGRSLTGFSMSGIFSNYAEYVSGVQAAGILTSTSIVNGVQFAGIGANAGYMSGVQFAGIGTRALRVDGMQFAGIIASSRVARGVQFSGVASNTGQMRGFQFAGLLNRAQRFEGVQFAGLFNYATELNGFQFAGLFNIAKKNRGGHSLAFVNIIGGGEMSVGVTTNEIGNIMAGFRSGGDILYGIVGLGFNPYEDKTRFVTQFGWGARIPVCNWFRIQNELSWYAFDMFEEDKNTFQYSFSIMPSFRPWRHFEVMAGPSLNFLMSDTDSDLDLFRDKSLWEKLKPDKNKQLYIGFSVGLQYIF